MNNLYNTVFWALVMRAGMGRTEAEQRLKGTLARDKNEILWWLGVNYNAEDEKWRKGSVVFREVSLLLFLCFWRRVGRGQAKDG